MVAGWLLAAALVAGVPEIERPVVDLAEVIEPAQEEQIASELVAHSERTGVQLAVLVVRTTEGQDIGSYAQEVFDQWGGGSAERDDGALFVLAVDDRRNRLHLGYGLEPVISDAVAKQLLDDLRPELKAGAYGDATAELVADVRARTQHLRPGDAIAAPRGGISWLWALLALLAVAFGSWWGATLRKILAPDKKHERKRLRGADGRWVATRFARTFAVLLDRRAQILVIAGLAGQAALIGLFWAGSGYVLAYTFTAALYFAQGWLAGGTPKTFSWTFGGCLVLVLCIGLEMGIFTPGVLEASDVAGLAGQFSVVTVIGGGMLGSCVWAGLYKPESGGSYSSSGYASTQHYPSSSSYSSTSSYASTPSYSSSSYDGGGGSSGGGGASSSW